MPLRVPCCCTRSAKGQSVWDMLRDPPPPRHAPLGSLRSLHAHSPAINRPINSSSSCAYWPILCASGLIGAIYPCTMPTGPGDNLLHEKGTHRASKYGKSARARAASYEARAAATVDRQMGAMVRTQMHHAHIGS